MAVNENFNPNQISKKFQVSISEGEHDLMDPYIEECLLVRQNIWPYWIYQFKEKNGWTLSRPNVGWNMYIRAMLMPYWKFKRDSRFPPHEDDELSRKAIKLRLIYEVIVNNQHMDWLNEDLSHSWCDFHRKYFSKIWYRKDPRVYGGGRFEEWDKKDPNVWYPSKHMMKYISVWRSTGGIKTTLMVGILRKFLSETLNPEFLEIHDKFGCIPSSHIHLSLIHI